MTDAQAMGALPAPPKSSWLSAVLRCLPASLLARLDAWSYRVAVQRAQRRRQAGVRRAQLTAQQRSGA